MRIDFSWGSDRSRVEHPIAELATLLLGRFVSARSFGPALPWLDVLFVERKGKKGAAGKAQWRWRGSFAQHVIVQVPAPDLQDLAPDAAVRTLVAVVIPAIERAQPLLDPDLEFDAAALVSAVRDCLAHGTNEEAIATVDADRMAEHDRRMIALKYGDEAMRRSWQRPLEQPLQWVRLYTAADRQQMSQSSALVAALLASALYQQVRTPRYKEIYINVGSDPDALRLSPVAVEDWHENAYAIVTTESVAGRDEAAVRRVLFDASRRALAELAAVDHLDSALIESLLADVDAEGLGTEFVYRRLRNDTHSVDVVYRLSEREDDGGILSPVHHLVATSIASGRSSRWRLGPIDLWSSSSVITGLVLKASQVQLVLKRDGRSEKLRFELPE